jgi:hypothetical protein
MVRSACDEVREVPVTFQVNLAIQELIGNFDPAAHTVEVHGSFDAWGPGIALTESQSEPGRLDTGERGPANGRTRLPCHAPTN